MSPENLLSLILPPGSANVAVSSLIDDHKFFAPSPIIDEADRLDLISQHLTGHCRPRECVSKAGKHWTARDHTSYGAYCLAPDGSCRWLCIDIDGPDHAKAQTDADVASLLAAVQRVMGSLNLAYFTERSSGAKGFHVWALFAQPVPGAFAHWLASSIAAQAIETCDRQGLTLEAFPKQAKAQSLGSLVALPLPGKPKAEGGGTILEPLDSIRTNETPCLLIQWQAHVAQEAIRAEQARQLRELAFAGTPEAPPVPGETIDLEAIIQALAPERITGQMGPDITMDCPRHASRKGQSLHVNPEKRVWFCHACRKGGSDKWAAYSLAKWLMVGADNKAVTKKINVLELSDVR